jgi:hypothetical protein
MPKKQIARWEKIVPILFMTLALSTCDAFKAGLGPKIDVSDPTIDATSIANGAYLRGTVSLAGTVADDVDVKSVSVIVVINSVTKATLNASVSKNAWKVNLNTASAEFGPEVQADLTLRVTDDSGKATDRKLVVYFDNKKPTLTSMSPTEANLGSQEYAIGERQTISGSVQDGLGVAKVELVTGSGANAIAYTDTTDAATWSIEFDASNYIDKALLLSDPAHAGLKGATYDAASGLFKVPYSVYATDLAGNVSDAVGGTLYVTDGGAPLVDINGQTPLIDPTRAPFPNPPDFGDLEAWKASTNSLSPGDTIKARIFDVDGLDETPAGTYMLLIPGSKKAQLDLGTLDLTPYTYTVSGLSSGGAACNKLDESVVMKTQLKDGVSAIAQKADFSFKLPAALTAATGSMPELGEYMLLVHAGDYAGANANKLPLPPATSPASAARTVPATVSGPTKYLSVYITKGTPAVTVSSPSNGAFVKNLVASGSVDDAFGIAGVSVSVDGGAAVSAACPGHGTTEAWTYTYSGPVLSDGLHSAAFTGLNLAGKTGNAVTVQFNVDNTPPVASVQSASPATASGTTVAFSDTAVALAPGGVVNVVNGWTRFKGLASDTASLSSVSWTLQRVANVGTWALDPTPVSSGAFATASMSLWTLDVNTTTLVDGDYYVLSVTPTDGAANLGAAAQRTFRVWQLSDLPAFSLTNMSDAANTSAAAKNNLLTTNIRLDATVSDDDRIDPAMIKILIDPMSGSTPSASAGNQINAGYESVTGTVNPTTGNVSFSYSFTTTGSGTGFALPTEGRHFFYLVANDDGSCKNGLGSQAVTMGPIWFAVDTHQPQISFDQAGGLYASSSQALSGTVASANALDNSAVSASPQPLLINGAAPTSIADPSLTGSHAWTYTLTITGATPEGPLAMTAVAKDEFGLSATNTFTVTVDKSAPVVSATTPGQGHIYSDYYGYSLTGTIRDQWSGVASMTATVRDSGSSVVAGPTLTWNATASTANTDGSFSLDLSSLSVGSYTVAFTALDKAGNAYTSPVPISVIVDKDTPTASFDTVLGAAVHGAVYNAAAAMPANWSGTVGDAFFSVAKVYLDGTQIGSDVTAAGAWTAPIDWAGVSQGSHTLSVVATDMGHRSYTAAATFIKDTVAPTLEITAPGSDAWLEGTTYRIRGGADDGAAGTGVFGVRFWIDDAAADHSGDDPTTWTAATGAASWYSDVALATLGEGSKKLWVKSRDKAGASGNWNAAATTVTFNVDLAAPRATETNHGPAVIQSRTDIAFAGKADDAEKTPLRAASIVELKYSKDGAAAVPVPLTVDLDGADNIAGNADDGSWSWTLQADPHGDGDHIADGFYVITLTVTDAAGKGVSVTRTAQIDTTAPLLAIGAPAADEATSDSTYDISGTARDTGGVGFDGTDDVEYNMNGAGWHAMNSLVSTINWSADDVSLGAGEGTKTLQVRATDKQGNQSAASVTFYYDLAPPSLSESTVGTTDTRYIRADQPFAGKASDSNALTSLRVSINGVVQVPDIAVDADGADNIPGNADDNSWSWTFPVAAKADGTYVLAFTAADAAKKTTAITRTVVLDVASPTVSGINSLAGWKIQASQNVSGDADDDTSGIDHVEYRVGAGAWNNLTGTESFSGAIAFPEGSSTLQIRAMDKAGNYSAVEAATNSQQTVQVDLTDPTAAITSPPTNPVLNGGSDLSLTVTVTDAASGSGLASASAYAYDIPGAIAKALHTTTTSGTSQSLTLTVPAADILSLSGGNPGTVHKICVVATDAVGRSSAVASLNFTLDKKLPTVVFFSHADNAEVNQLITLSGTSSDENGVNACVVQVHNRQSDLWENVSSGTASGSTAWSLADFSTIAFSAVDGDYDDTLADSISQLRLRALATDAAGNQASVERILAVDQNSDRPVIRLSNLAALNGASKLKMTRVVYGTISDDDGYSIGEGASEKKLKLDVSEVADFSTFASVAIEGGSWSYTASAGDGMKRLYFRATDAKEKVFVTDTSATESLDEPRVWQSAGPPVTYWHDRVSFMVDTVPPKIAESKPVLVDRTGPVFSDFDGGVELTNGMAFGGSSPIFAVRVLASDANGIASVKVTVPGAVGSPFTASPAGADADQPDFTRFETGPISVATTTDGAVSLNIDVTDTSELTTSTIRTILVDNTAPTITFITPSIPAAVINGGQNITGSASDSGSGLSAVTYGLGINYSNGGDPAMLGTKLMWTIPFVDSAAYHAGTESFHDNYTGSDIYILPIVVRAEDAAGNVRQTAPMTLSGVTRGASTTSLQSEALKAEPYKSLVKTGQVILVGNNARVITAYSSATGVIEWAGAVDVSETSITIYEFCLRINPNADLPTASMSYPTNGTTMGGNVRMYGLASDDDGVSEVWMQIDTNGDGFFDAADDAIGSWYSSNQGKKIEGAANWSQTINEGKEFDPSGADPRKINVRVRAKDIYNTFGPWSTPYLVLIDKNVPQFGSAQAFYLEKVGDPSTKITYTPGVIVKGDWILRGSIEDDGAISAITISEPISAAYVRGSGADAFDDVTPAVEPDTDKYRRVDLAVPITTTSLGASGTLSFTLTAVDNAKPTAHETIQTLRIRYDNQTPTASLVSPTSESATVVQSNGWYKVKGKAGDLGSDIERVEVYFLRRGRTDTAQDRIYNPASSDAKALLSTISIDANGSPLKSGTADSYTTTSLTDDALAGNALIHTGQKVLVGSELHTISAYNSGSGRIDWNDGAISSAITSYSIRLAIQIDNKSTEVRDSGTGVLTTDDGDGYLEYLKQDAGNDYTWYVDIDSLNIPDGPIEIHWVAYDTAGNAVHGSTPYKTDAGYYSVKNNGPRVASIQLGTDINGAAGIEEGEKQTFTYASDSAASETIAVAFKASDKMFLRPIVTNGNGDLVVGISAGGYSATGVAYRTGASMPGIELSDANLTTAGQGSRTFTLTIWDSTEETVAGSSSQSIVRGVTCTVANMDGTAPKAAVRPLYWNGATSNSLFGDSVANGHIDIASNASNGTGDADVSGKVSFRGVAYDETRIVNVYAYIGNGTDDTGAFAFLGVSNTRVVGSRTYYRLASFDGTWHGSSYSSLANDWQFTVPDSAIDQNGHRIAWQLDWNSAAISGGAATDRIVSVLVEDKAGTANAGSQSILSGSGTRTVTTLTNYAALRHQAIAVGTPVILRNGSEEAYFTRVKEYDYENGVVTLLSDSVPTDKASYTILLDSDNDPALQVDVVPYVADIKCKLPFVDRVPDVAPPSPLYGKKGYFPVFQEQVGIDIEGFNLPYVSTSSIDGNGTLTVGATTYGTNATGIANELRRKLTVSIPASQQTGAVTVTTNGVASINNANENAREYNVDSGAVFSDDRYLYVDQTLPSISIAPFGRRYSAAAKDADKSLAAVSSYNENISMSGSARLGHVEYAEYSNYSGIPVSINASNDRLNASAHGLATGQLAQLRAATAPTVAAAVPVDPATQYRVIRLDADYFMLARSLDSALLGTVGSWTATSITDAALIGKTQISTGTWEVVLPSFDVKTITSFDAATGAIGWSGSLGAQSDAYVILPAADLVDFDGPGTGVSVADPEVSGEVVIRGKAYDDQRIESITATISGPGTETFQGDADGGAFTIYSSTPDGSGGLTGTFVDTSYGAYGWKMELEESGTEYKLTNARLDSGHVFNWKFTWNSAKISTQAAADIKIAFTIKDYNSAGQSRTTTQSVDVVPYISGVIRSGLTTNRGRFGAYTLQQSEASLTLKGFNLRRSGTGDGVRVSRSGTSGTGADLTATGGGADPYTSLVVTAGTNSGWLKATTNGVDSINNVNDNGQAWNKENDSNAYTANWTDDRYVRIWQVGTYFNNSDGATYPSMTQDTNYGTLIAAWVAESANSVRYNTVSGTSRQAFKIYDPPKFSDINIYPGDTNLSLAFLANYQGGSWGTAPTFDTAGGMAAYTASFTDAAAPTFTGTASSVAWDTGYNNRDYPIEALNNDQQMSQFEEPRVVRYNNEGTPYVHVAYYDKHTSAVKVASFQDNGSVNLNQPKGWIVLDGNSNAQDTTGTAGYGRGVLGGGVANAGYTPNYESVSIDVDEEGRPTVIYYDNVNRTLKLARCSSNSSFVVGNWTRQDVFKSDDAYKSYAGQHVMMKFDSVGNLHVVFFRNGYPYYIYAPDADGTTAYSFDYAVRIDDMGSLASIGEWPDIALDGAMPAVSYLTASAGSYDGLKYAAPKHQKAAVTSSFTTSVTSNDLIGNTSFAAGDLITFPSNSAANLVRTVTAYDSATGTVTFAALASAPTNGTKFIVYKPGTWDYEVIPADSNVQKDRTNIEVRKSTKASTDWGDTAVAYRSNRIELVYLKEEQ